MDNILWNGFYLKKLKVDRINRIFRIIRLRLNTLQLAAGLKGKANRAVAPLSEGGLSYGAIPL